MADSIETNRGLKFLEDLKEARRIRMIVGQLQEVGWSKVGQLDQNFRTLSLIYKDESTDKVSNFYDELQTPRGKPQNTGIHNITK